MLEQGREVCSRCHGQGVVEREYLNDEGIVVEGAERCRRCDGSGMEPPPLDITVIDGMDGFTPEMLRQRGVASARNTP